jgi:predicted 3-demethylubiquinone-9 3-methyltransferase (glyoxalase superfamily)
MSGGPIVPCLWFDDQAESAANFYVSVFPGGRLSALSHYPASGENPSGKPPGSVLTVEFEIGGLRFTGLNGGPTFTPNPSISFFAEVDSAAEADQLFAALAETGQVLMPLGAYPWSERYGWVMDRFGVSWQVMTRPGAKGDQSIVPCLMFTGAQKGRAYEAMELYASIFPNSRLDDVARYEEDEGPTDSVKHGRFTLAGQRFVAMDSHIEHAFALNEAISLQVMCKDQREVDRYWDALSEGGEKGPCGWLKDRFGLSWQVVPEAMFDWLSSEDVAARDRAFRAMLDMSKLDIAALQAAFEGS